MMTSTPRWKKALRRLLPFLFVRCPSGREHWFFERWCQCRAGERAVGEREPEKQGAEERKAEKRSAGNQRAGRAPQCGVFDLKRWEEARQGPRGYRPQNTNLRIGDYVQPEGLELSPPLAWKVVGFEARGRNPKYKIVIEYPFSGERLTLDNLPRNVCPPEEASSPETYDVLFEIGKWQPSG